MNNITLKENVETMQLKKSWHEWFAWICLVNILIENNIFAEFST